MIMGQSDVCFLDDMEWQGGLLLVVGGSERGDVSILINVKKEAIEWERWKRIKAQERNRD